MAKPKTIKEYLASVPATHRPALKQLHGQIKKIYPRVTEHISYGVPLYKLDSHPLVAFKASKTHSGFFVWSSTVLGKLKNKLEKYDTGKGTIRFAPDKPLPLSIVKIVLKVRAQEIKDRWG